MADNKTLRGYTYGRRILPWRRTPKNAVLYVNDGIDLIREQKHTNTVAVDLNARRNSKHVQIKAGRYGILTIAPPGQQRYGIGRTSTQTTGGNTAGATLIIALVTIKDVG